MGEAGRDGGLEATETRQVGHSAAKAVDRVRARLDRGAQIDRYVIVDRVGAGGMGEVYLAYDPDLDRRVAIKILRPSAADSTGSSDGRARLLREGQAMAKLSHPNVATVFDVGPVGDDVFIALEFVEGGTVRDWLRERRRAWRDVLGVFVRAGRGLAAAHASGVVHRDFKPSNVLLGVDGQVRVMDFGLARTSAGHMEESQPASGVPLDVTPGGDLLTTNLTVPGTAMGTPAYMAPEQHRGEPADTRSDQFSFCVALYEGLYGERPFAGETEEAVRSAVVDGKVRDPPADTRVPTRIRRVLVRGLSVDPGARFSSIDDLLSELIPMRRSAWRWVAIASLVGIALASYVGFRAGQDEKLALCERDDGRFTEIWSGARQAGLREAFVATGLAYAGDTWDRTQQTIDDYIEAWQAAHVEACEATHVRHEQSEDLLDLRMVCLSERREQVRALVDSYAGPDPRVVENAVSLAHGLSPITACSDPNALRTRIRPPKDPRVRARVAELERGLEKGRALLHALHYEDAKRQVQTTLEQVQQLGYAPLEAEALALAARIAVRTDGYETASEAYLSAIRAAEATGHDLLKARLWVALGALVSRSGSFDEGERYLDLAEAALRGAGGDAELQADLLKERGVLLANRGDHEAAFETTERALALRRDTFGSDDLSSAHLMNNLGVFSFEQGRRRKAQQWLQRSVDLKRRLMGDDHPVVGAALLNLGEIALENDDLILARNSIEQTARIYDGVVATDGSKHAIMLVATAALAEAEGDLGRAVLLFEQAVGIFERTGPRDHPQLAQVRHSLGLVLLDDDDGQRAVDPLERSVDVRTRQLGDDSAVVADTLATLARARHAAGDTVAARDDIARALRILERPRGNDAEIADADFEVARAMWELGMDRTQATARARRAHEALDRDGMSPRALHKVARWLEAHPNP